MGGQAYGGTLVRVPRKVAVHRSGGWCSVDLFRVNRQRGSSYAAGADNIRISVYG